MPPIPTERVILGLPGRVVFALLVLLATAVFVYSMSRRIRVLLAGRPDDRFRDVGRRIGKTLEYAFAQRRMFRDFYAGFFHILIFSGFVVLTVRSITGAGLRSRVVLCWPAGRLLHPPQGRVRSADARRRPARRVSPGLRAAEAPGPVVGRVADSVPHRPAHGDRPDRGGGPDGPRALLPPDPLVAGRAGHRANAGRREHGAPAGALRDQLVDPPRRPGSSGTTCRTRSTSTSSRRFPTSSS